MSTPPHVLVVVASTDDLHDFDYSIAEHNVTDSCRAWAECIPCTKRAAADVAFDEELAEVQFAHDIDHQRINGVWMTPTDRCYVADHEYLYEAAAELRPLSVGSYPVSWDTEADGEFLTLTREDVPE